MSTRCAHSLWNADLILYIPASVIDKRPWSIHLNPPHLHLHDTASFSYKFHASFEDYKGFFIWEYAGQYELINVLTTPYALVLWPPASLVSPSSAWCPISDVSWFPSLFPNHPQPGIINPVSPKRLLYTISSVRHPCLPLLHAQILTSFLSLSNILPNSLPQQV